MTIADNLQSILNAKQGMRAALEGRGVDMEGKTFSDFPQIIAGLPASSGGHKVGDIVHTKADQEAEGWLPCDGGLYSAAAYPELAELCSAIQGPNAPAPEGFFWTPNIPVKSHGNITLRPMIKAEEL